MSKKHFIELADLIRNAVGTSAEFSPQQIDKLADFCRSQNYSFKGERWVEYINGKCDPNGGRIKAEKGVCV